MMDVEEIVSIPQATIVLKRITTFQLLETLHVPVKTKLQKFDKIAIAIGRLCLEPAVPTREGCSRIKFGVLQ